MWIVRVLAGVRLASLGEDTNERTRRSTGVVGSLRPSGE